MRTSNKLTIENEIMKENQSRFELMCSPPVFLQENIYRIGAFSQNEETYNLIYIGIPINYNHVEIISFLQLLYQLKYREISFEIDTK